MIAAAHKGTQPIRRHDSVIGSYGLHWPPLQAIWICACRHGTSPADDALPGSWPIRERHSTIPVPSGGGATGVGGLFSQAAIANIWPLAAQLSGSRNDLCSTLTGGCLILTSTGRLDHPSLSANAAPMIIVQEM